MILKVSLFRTTVLACLAFAVGSPALADEWTGWLGSQRDGRVTSFQPPKPWPDRLSKDWELEVGAGYGTPLVANGNVYQHARLREEEVLWCIDLQTGKTKWQQKYAVPFKVGGGGEYHGKGPKSSPVMAGGRIFTMSITGVITAWNANSGEQLWQRDYSARFENHKRPYPYWGHSTSPIVANDLVIVHVGPDKEGVLLALDVETGKEVWSHGKDGPSYSSPLVAEFEGIQQVVEWNHRAVVGVEIKTGKFLWEYPFPHVGSDQNMPTPTIFNGMVLVGGENRGILGLRPKREGDEWRVALKWHAESVALNMSSAVINDGKLFGFSHYDRGRMFCLDPESGEVLWEGPPRTGNNVMFLAVPGHIVALINTGELKMIAANGEAYREVASYRVAESQSWAPPVLLTNGVLVKDETTLRKWSFKR